MEFLHRMFRPAASARAACALALAAGLAGAPSTARAHGSLHRQILEAGRRIESDPDSASLYLMRAGLLRLDGRSSAALVDYDRALEYDPNLCDAFLGRAHILYERGRHGEALVEIDNFLAAEPGHPGALVLRARLLDGLGRRDEATACMRHAIEIDPACPPERNLECSRMIADSDAPAVAIAVLDLGLARLGPVATLLFYAIELEEARGETAHALARLDALLPGYPRPESLLERRGAILESAGFLLEALVTYTDALDAIARLPAHVRDTPSARVRESRVRARLRALSPEGP